MFFKPHPHLTIHLQALSGDLSMFLPITPLYLCEVMSRECWGQSLNASDVCVYLLLQLPFLCELSDWNAFIFVILPSEVLHFPCKTEETGETLFPFSQAVLECLHNKALEMEPSRQTSKHRNYQDIPVNFRFMCDYATSFPRMYITWEGRTQESKVNIFIIPKM